MPTNLKDQKRKLLRKTCQAYKARIMELREAGEEEGIEVNESSERDFWAFIRVLPAIREGALFLMENGNFRVIWKGPDESHLGLQFLGNREIQYVIFKRRKRARKVSRVAGADTFDGVRRQIEGFRVVCFGCSDEC